MDALSFHVPRGTVFGLLGPNGAGKTTTIRMIMNITAPDSGEIRILGAPMDRQTQNRIGYLPEERGLYRKMKVHRPPLLPRGDQGRLDASTARKRIGDWLDKMELRPWLNKKVDELSKGMQQKVQFIATIVHDPEILILDEVFSGLDPINTALIKEYLNEFRARGKTIVFSTHVLEQAEKLCDEICLIARSKKILEGNLKELKKQLAGDLLRLSRGRLARPRSRPSPESLPCQPVNGAYVIALAPGTDRREFLRHAFERYDVEAFSREGTGARRDLSLAPSQGRSWKRPGRSNEVFDELEEDLRRHPARIHRARPHQGLLDRDAADPLPLFRPDRHSDRCVSQRAGGERRVVVVDLTGHLYEPLAKDLARAGGDPKSRSLGAAAPLHWILERRPIAGDLEATKEALARKSSPRRSTRYLILDPAESRRTEVEYYSTTVSEFVAINQLERAINRIQPAGEDRRARPAGRSRRRSSRSAIDLKAFKVTEKGAAEEKGAGIVAALIFFFLMYSTFFMYGYQVMRGVIEEKTNRIVEVIIASVRPDGADARQDLRHRPRRPDAVPRSGRSSR